MKLSKRQILIFANEVHDKQVALMKFLSNVALKLGIAEHVYVVGGAVRDFIIGHPIKDVDVVIDSVALNGKDSEWFAKQIQKELGESSLATNNYGVAILSITGSFEYNGYDLKGEVIEIANARQESYGGVEGKGYKPSDVNVAKIEEDVFRREFTFNTLMWKLSQLVDGPEKAEIIDLTGCGLKDLKNGEMACPSDPDKTFSDDPTRMLRAIKFLVRYGWKINSEVKAAIQRNAPKLKEVPYEAVFNILVGNILKESTYKIALKEMKELGLLTVVSEMIKENKDMANAFSNWSHDKRVQFLLDLIEEGIPSITRFDFLSPDQKQKFKEQVPNLQEPEALLDVLKQPGKSLDIPYLMKELSLKGSQVKLITDMAREIALEEPEIIKNKELYTFVVYKRIKGD